VGCMYKGKQHERHEGTRVEDCTPMTRPILRTPRIFFGPIVDLESPCNRPTKPTTTEPSHEAVVPFLKPSRTPPRKHLGIRTLSAAGGGRTRHVHVGLTSNFRRAISLCKVASLDCKVASTACSSGVGPALLIAELDNAVCAAPTATACASRSPRRAWAPAGGGGW